LPRIGPVLYLSLVCACAALPVRAAQPKAVIEGEMDRDLRGEVVRAVGEVKAPPQSRIEARRRAREAGSDVLALLRSEGYYEAEVVADISAADPPVAEVKVTPGRRFVLADPVIGWSGAPPAAPALKAVHDAVNLQKGAPGRAADIIAAEGRAVAVLLALGYADAAAQPREVVVDHADYTVRPTFRIAAGDLARMGALEITGSRHTRRAWVRSLAPWKSGDVYDPAKLTRLERRLVETGTFESATATLAPAGQGANGVRPVQVALVEAPRRTLEIGAAWSTTAGAGFDTAAARGGSSFGVYSTIEGSGVDAKWIHYNLLGVGDTTTLTARLYDIQQVLDLELALPDWRRPDQILKTGADALNERTPAFNDSGGGLRAVIERHWTKTNFLTLGGYLDYVSLAEKDAVNPQSTPVGVKLNLFIPTAVVAFNLDRSNDILDPTRGWRVQVRAEPTYVTGDRQIAYVKTRAQASGYVPFDADGTTVLAGRLAFGSILAGQLPDVPADRRFYSGGGGSVRGLPYQGVGPRLADNTPEGGLSLAEASLEVRRKVAQRWGVVGFIDAGSVGTTPAPEFHDVSYGVGVGVRYDLGFGPLRLDLATPLNPRQGDAAVQVYISLGQSF
jgi:translocation and assembly module TamA